MGIMYAVALPLSVLLFGLDVLDWDFIGGILLLLVLEHLSQELGRFLVAIAAPLAASMVLFLRSGMWPVIAVVWMWLVPDRRDLDTLFLCWVAGNLVGIFVGGVRCSFLGVGGWG